MLDFLSKFVFRRPTAGKPPTPSASEIAAVQIAESKKIQSEGDRAATLAKIDALSNDEPAAIALLLSCDFADGRLKAAQHVHSQAGLEQVRAAMLKLDKRVVKLMQTRLDVIAQTSQQEQLARLCVEEATYLAQQAHLMPNQVVDLDKRRAAITAFPDNLTAQFNQLRQQIAEKMLAQTTLQRRVLDVLQQLNQLAAAEEVETSLEEQQAQWQQWQQELDNCQNQPEASSLPKSLLNDCTTKLQAQHQRLQGLAQEKKKTERRVEVKLDTVAPEATVEVSATDEAIPAAVLSDEPAAAPDVASAPPRDKTRVQKSVPSLSVSQIIAAIDGMAEALEQGSIQNARKFDKDLRGVDAKTAGLNAEQKDRLFQARSELGYLQGWAKWGGDVSRDELISAVVELPTLALAPNELAKKVAAMRERWRAMEASSGAASKDLWERFDAACKTAYAPAAVFFLEQDELRKANLLIAEAALTELRSTAGNLLQATPDWKAISNFCMQAQQNWKKLGHVDRKHKNRLDAEFEASLQLLRQPLEQRRKEEIISREALIAEVAALDPQQRSATDQLKVMQERWQAQASSVPLRRKDEQALWERFRAACDNLFAQRKQASGEADAQRKENLAVKTALCIVLEEAIAASDANLPRLLQQTANNWKNVGAVPRAEEPAIEQRYQAAVLAVKQHGQQLLNQRSELSKASYLKKLSACQTLESMLMQDLKDEERAQKMAQLKADWAQSGDLTPKLNNAMQLRFESVLAALEGDDQGYRTLLQNNSAEFDTALLHLEILSGIDSPAELSRERLQMQVEVLQTSLKRGTDAFAHNEALHRLLTMPMVLDPAKQHRLEKVLSASDAI